MRSATSAGAKKDRRRSMAPTAFPDKYATTNIVHRVLQGMNTETFFYRDYAALCSIECAHEWAEAMADAGAEAASVPGPEFAEIDSRDVAGHPCAHCARSIR